MRQPNNADITKLKAFLATIESHEQNAKRALEATSEDPEFLVETVRKSISFNMEARWKGKTALHYAAEMGCYNLVGFLIECKNADMNAHVDNGTTERGFTPLDLVNHAIEKNTLMGKPEEILLVDKLKKTREYLRENGAATMLDLQNATPYKTKKSWRPQNTDTWKKEILKNRIAEHLDPDVPTTEQLREWFKDDGPARN